MKIVACLIDKGEDIYGLRALREREADFIDITSYENGLSDATSTTVKQLIIKNDRVYSVVKTYFDLDNNQRILLAKECTETFDKLVAHSWGDWNITVLPTETSTGIAKRICQSEDDHEETVVVPKLTDGSVWSVATYIPETCENVGSRTYTSIYGSVTVEVPATGHNYGSWTIVTEPTETSTGTARRICTNDGTHVEIVDLPVLTDTSVWSLGTRKEPSCTITGHQIYTSIYGNVTVVLDAIGHDYGEFVMTTEPTETKTGVATKVCSRNNTHTTTTTIPVLTDESFWTVKSTTDPTCTVAGEKIYTSIYGDVSVTIPATGHNYGSWTIVTEPTESSTGTARRVCEHDATHIETITIPSLSNESVWTISDSKSASCEEDGYTKYTSIYGNVTITIPATGHNYGSWILTTLPTITDGGVATKKCANDSTHIETVAVPNLADTTVWEVRSYNAPTCSVTGSRTYASIYGNVTITIPATGHNYGEWTIVTEPTETSTGTARRVCEHDANHIETVTIPILTDTTVWAVSDMENATCENDGYTEYTSIYGVITVTSSATGHNYGEWTIVTEPTETSTGTARRVCEHDANHIETVDLPILTDTTVWTVSDMENATCEEDGYTKYTSIYGNVTITIPATGHTYGEWEIVTEPTTTTTGLKQRVCVNDPSHIETEEIPMLTE